MDGSNMPPAPAKERPIWNGTKKFAGWMRRDFAEWFVGSWAMAIGYGIFATIFFNFLLMDGHFSRGLGEGSGVNPDRFQQTGWAYRCFAALFMVLAVKLTHTGLKNYAIGVRVLGGFITVIVVLHATGFGLKALEGKRATAESVEAVAVAQGATNDALLTQLRKQVADIDAGLAASLAPINAEIAGLDNDGSLANDRRSDNLRDRRAKLEDQAAADRKPINDQISALIASGGEQRSVNAAATATNEKWAPLFVGLAQLFTWSTEPSDWAIYLCGVIFIIFWVIVGDLIAIFLPSALYALHLADAKNPKVKLSADSYKDLQARADELERRMANLSEGAQRAQTTKKKKKNRELTKNLLQDHRTEMAKKDFADKQRVDEAINEMSAEYVDEDTPDPEPVPEQPEAEGPAVEEQPEQQDELVLSEEVTEDSEGEPELEEEPHAPAVIEDETPANEGEDERDERKPLQAAE